MSPRIALATACSDSPSKLKVTAPVVARRPGGGDAAAPVSMTTLVPRRSCGAGSRASTSAATVVPATVVPAGMGAAAPAGGAARRSPSREIVGAGTVAQPARRAATSSVAARAPLWGIAIIRRTLPLLGGRRRGWYGLARLAPELVAPGLDAPADRVHLCLG